MMRRQAYEWRGYIPSATWPEPYTLNLQPVLSATPVIPQITANHDYDIFVGGFGTNLDIPGFVKATQFIVIDEISCWPPQSTIQPWVETTRYFQNPDRSTMDGLVGWSIPFIPGGGADYSALGIFNTYSFRDTPMYVRPGQTWGVYWRWPHNTPQTLPTWKSTGAALTVDYTAGATNAGDSAGDLKIPRVYVEYVLYDGIDAIIANRLIRQGDTVSVKKVEAYKRALIRYKLMADIVDREENKELHQQIPRKFS